MIENLIFSLNRVTPFFLLILLGYFIARKKIVPEEFLKHGNRYVYKLALPVNLFYGCCNINWDEPADVKFLLFLFFGILFAYLAIWGVTELVYKDKALIGTLVQGGFRGNYSLLGIPLTAAVLGEAARGKAALASAVIIPLYNVLAVVVLLARGKKNGNPDIKKTARHIATNPLIIGTLSGVVVSLLPFKISFILDSTLVYIANTATPIGLLCIGGIFSWKAATARIRPAIYATCVKILVLPLVMMPVAYLCGFRGTELFILFITFGAPVAVSSFSMAAEMGGDGPLASNILILTTFLSAFVLAFGIYIMRAVGWI